MESSGDSSGGPWRQRESGRWVEVSTNKQNKPTCRTATLPESRVRLTDLKEGMSADTAAELRTGHGETAVRGLSTWTGRVSGSCRCWNSGGESSSASTDCRSSTGTWKSVEKLVFCFVKYDLSPSIVSIIGRLPNILHKQICTTSLLPNYVLPNLL